MIFEYRTIWKPCFALPNYHIWLSHQFQVAGTYSCRVTASKLSEILFQRVLGCNWYHKMGIPLWMGVQSVSSQGPRIVALHSQILFTLQVIQIFHKNLDILGAIFYENLWTFCVLSFFWNIFLDLKIVNYNAASQGHVLHCMWLKNLVAPQLWKRSQFHIFTWF